MKILQYKIGVLLLLALSLPVQASIDFIENRFGVRPLGMGGAYTGLAEGPESIFYNWAKPPTLDQLYFKVENGARLGTPFYAVAFQSPYNIPELRFGYIYMSDSGIPETILNVRSQPQETGESFANTMHAMFASWQFSFFGLNFGVQGNHFSESLKDATGSATNLHVSSHKSFSFWGTEIDTALTVKNLVSTNMGWSTSSTDKIYPLIMGGLNVNALDRKLNVALDLDFEVEKTKRPKKYYAGIEYWFSGNVDIVTGLALRAGSRNGDITAGVGLYFDGLMIDYAYVQPKLTFLELEHRFSIGWSLYDFKPMPTKKEEFDPFPESNIQLDSLSAHHGDLMASFEKSRIAQHTPLPIPEKAPEPGLALLLEISNPATGNLATLNLSQLKKSFSLRINGDGYTKTSQASLPMTVVLREKLAGHLARINIEKTRSEHLILSGQMPPFLQIMVNDSLLEKNPEGDFFYKIPIRRDRATPLEILIFVNDN